MYIWGIQTWNIDYMVFGKDTNVLIRNQIRRQILNGEIIHST